MLSIQAKSALPSPIIANGELSESDSIACPRPYIYLGEGNPSRKRALWLACSDSSLYMKPQISRMVHTLRMITKYIVKAQHCMTH